MPVTRYAMYIYPTYVMWKNMHIFFNTEWIFMQQKGLFFNVIVIEELISFQNKLIIALLHTKICSCPGCILQFQCITCDTTSDTRFLLNSCI